MLDDRAQQRAAEPCACAGATSAARRSSTSCWCSSCWSRLFLGILQVALVLHVRNTLTAAASEGARYAATARPRPDDGAARTRSRSSGALAGRFARDVTAREATVDGAPGVEVDVTAEVPAARASGARRSRSTSPATRSRSSAVRRASRRARQRAGRAHLARILLLVPLLWIVLSVFQVQRGAFAVSGAARAAGAGLRARARRRDRAGRARGRGRRRAGRPGACDGATLDGAVTCTPYPDDCHSGTSVITVRSPPGRLPLMPERARRQRAEVRPRGDAARCRSASSGRTGRDARRARHGHAADRRLRRSCC